MVKKCLKHTLDKVDTKSLRQADKFLVEKRKNMSLPVLLNQK